jgi:ferredoxin
MTSGRVLHVNPIACAGRALCAEVAPELIQLDDWGFPIIESGPVPPGLIADAEAAVRICPLLALRLLSAPQGADHDRTQHYPGHQVSRSLQ